MRLSGPVREREPGAAQSESGVSVINAVPREPRRRAVVNVPMPQRKRKGPKQGRRRSRARRGKPADSVNVRRARSHVREAGDRIQRLDQFLVSLLRSPQGQLGQEKVVNLAAKLLENVGTLTRSMQERLRDLQAQQRKASAATRKR